MTAQTPEAPKNKGGRPKKYQTLAEAKLARKAKAVEKRLAALQPAAPTLPSPTLTPLQASITAAVSALNIPDAAFVTALCGGMTQAKAYRTAHPGCSVSSSAGAGASKAAEPKIAQAIADVKEAMAAAAEYSFVAFIAEMDQAILFAQQTRNATAYVRAVELKAKSTGHLSDKPTGGTEGFVLQIMGIATPGLPLEAEHDQ